MSKAVLDDHLLRDLLADDVSTELRRLLARRDPATTNLYLFRLCRSVVSAAGGALTGSWAPDQRRALGARLVALSDEIEVVSMSAIAFRMAEIAAKYRVSTLGSEAVAAAEHLGAPLCVWRGDDGPGVRAAATALRVDYRTVSR